jgi:hypothetical protein
MIEEKTFTKRVREKERKRGRKKRAFLTTTTPSFSIVFHRFFLTVLFDYYTRTDTTATRRNPQKPIEKKRDAPM